MAQLRCDTVKEKLSICSVSSGDAAAVDSETEIPISELRFTAASSGSGVEER